MIHTEVGRWVFTPPLGKLVYKTYVDDVDTGVTADLLKNKLLTSFPSDFAPVSQFGHNIPGYKLRLPGGAVRLVELEVFDY